jgi:hypothetical protein
MTSLVVVAWWLSAAAAPPERVQAREALDRAVTAFDRGDFQLALTAFERVYALQPKEELRFNIGLCLEKLGRLRDAFEAYSAARASGALDAEGLARADSRMKDVRARLATVALKAPAGAELHVDRALSCTAPCELVVDPGAHTWEVGTQSGSIVGSPGASVLIEPAPPPAARPEPSPALEPQVSAAPPPWSPRWAMFAGAALAVGGGGGIIGFGLWSNQLLTAYKLAPTKALADQGELVTLVANVCIGVAVVGLLTVAIDLLTGDHP